MSQDVRHRLDELDVESAIGDEEPPVDEAPTTVVLPERKPGLEDEMEPEDLEEQLEDGTSGPEEESLHLDEPVTEMLDDETEMVEEALDEDQRAELEYGLDATRRR